jgi:UDP-2,4-diacetamido-2,4,6-trideoxy-beta-L-altropyranose hydrolase
LILRADAGSGIGTGHVMRCLAIAQAYRDRGGRALFASVDRGGLGPRLEDEGCDLASIEAAPGSDDDARTLAALARQRGARWVALDGYHFGALYQEALIAAGVRVLVVDDYAHAGRYPAELILNHNLYASEAMYPNRSPRTRLLLGTRYALLRREFRAHGRPDRRGADGDQQLLVTLGGADPENVTGTVLTAVASLGATRPRTVVVVGAANPHREALRAAAAAAGAELVQNVVDMPARMAWADLAVAAGGGTCWELCYFGVPMVLAVLADNQRPVVKALAAHGAAIDLGETGAWSAEVLASRLRTLLEDRAARARLGRAAAGLVDGSGAERVVDALGEAADG